MKLVIVESPAKAKKIQSILGDDFIVKSSVGHICDLPKGSLGIDTESFHCQYQVSDSKRGVVAGLRKAVAQASTVFLATDLDREGEAIAWHLKRILKLSQYQRIVFNEITKNAITQALNSGRQIDNAMVRSQESRRIIDRLVGYMVSPEVNARCQHKLTAGRVQSVAVRLVVENDIERNQFVPTPYNVVILDCNAGGTPFKAVFDNMAHEIEHLQDNTLTQQIANVSSLVVSHIETKPKSTKPPAPFITSTYTQAMSAKHKVRPKAAMSLAQTLFENGLITYHRTDSPALASEAIDAIRQFLSSKGISIPATPNVFKSKGDAQEAHEAIRPTNFDLLRLDASMFSNSNLDVSALNKAYQMIWMRAVSSQMLPFEEDVTTVLLLADDTYQFVAKGRRTTQIGWRQLTAEEAEKEQDDANDSIIDDKAALPLLETGQRVSINVNNVSQRKTQPPALYSEASLTKLLERHGIGRPSTYASIMDKIVSYGYVSLDKGKLSSTDVGIALYKLMVNQFSFMRVDYTRDIESQLDLIANGRGEQRMLCSKIFTSLSKEISSLPSEKIAQNPIDENVKCLECGRPMRLIQNKFWGCTGYDDGCKVTYAHVKGKPVVKKRENRVVDESAPDCPACKKGKLIKRTSKKGAFYGCSLYPKCKHGQSDI